MIDHLVWGAPDLAAACSAFESMTGITPAFGGRHTHGGTWNALVSLGPRQYLEIIAPNPEQIVDDPWRNALCELIEPAMFKLCMSSERGLDWIADTARMAGVSGEGPFDDGRVAPGGQMLQWRLFMPDDGEFPFFIDWLNCPHPGASTENPGCGMIECWIEHPDTDPGYSAALEALKTGLSVMAGPTHLIRAKLDTPRGLIIL